MQIAIPLLDLIGYLIMSYFLGMFTMFFGWLVYDVITSKIERKINQAKREVKRELRG